MEKKARCYSGVAATEQTFGVANVCNLSKAKETVEVFKTYHSFLNTNEPVIWLVFQISGPLKGSCWRTFPSLELVLTGVLPWGNGSRDRDKGSSGDKISESSILWTTVPSLISCESPSYKKLFGLLIHVAWGITAMRSANSCASSGKLPAGLSCFPWPWLIWWNHSPDCLEQINSWQNPA